MAEMTTAKKEGDEWAASVLAGEMKNSWQKEDRPNIPDTRLSHMRQHHIQHKSPGWYDNYDNIFGRREDG
jgi:hypothetical protein